MKEVDEQGEMNSERKEKKEWLSSDYKTENVYIIFLFYFLRKRSVVLIPRLPYLAVAIITLVPSLGTN